MKASTATVADRHPTIPVAHPDDGFVDIDAELAPVVTLMWQLGLMTEGCCQEGKANNLYVGMETLDDMARFYDLLREEGDAELYEPLFHDMGWEWAVWADGGLRAHVEFPRADLAWLEARLRAAVQATGPAAPA